MAFIYCCGYENIQNKDGIPYENQSILNDDPTLIDHKIHIHLADTPKKYLITSLSLSSKYGFNIFYHIQ